MYEIIPTKHFQISVEYYMKKRKYTHIQQDIGPIIQEIETGNLVGVELSNLNVKSNGRTYKVRAANTDAKVGKSNGYRIIYYVEKDDMEVYLLTIYSKKDDNRIPSDQEIAALVEGFL